MADDDDDKRRAAAYAEGFRAGMRAAEQTFGGIFNEEARAFGLLQDPTLQAIRARVKHRMRQRMNEECHGRWGKPGGLRKA